LTRPIELVIFDCGGVLVDSERLALGFASGLTTAEHLHGPGTMVFSDMRDLPRLLARDPRP